MKSLMSQGRTFVMSMACAGLLALTAGCGLTAAQKSALHQFGSATVEFSELTRSEFVQTRAEVIEMNRARVLLGDESVTNLDGFFTLDHAQDRLRALAALSDYGRLLQTLLVTGSEAELQASADRFLTSLSRVRDVDLKPMEAETLGKVIVWSGGVLVERRRARVARAVVDQAHPHVVRLIKLVERDFSPDADFWSAGYRRTRMDLEHAIRQASRSESGADTRSLRAARLAAREYPLRFDQVCAQVVETAEQLGEAELNLHKAMQGGALDLDHVQAFGNRVIEMRQVLEILDAERRAAHHTGTP